MVRMQIEGHEMSGWLIGVRMNSALATFRQESAFLRQPIPLSELEIDRGAVSQLAVDYALLCEGLRDGVTYDADLARKSAQIQVDMVKKAMNSVQGHVAISGGDPQAAGLPAGVKPEDYFLGPAYIAALERAQVRRTEEARIVKGHPDLAPTEAMAAWLRAILPRYRVKVEGLGQFSIPDAYAAFRSAQAIPR
jgi:hypothetical protein